MNEPHRLYRAADDRWIAGVAAGVARYFDVDPAVVRVLWVISAFITSGITALVYLIMVVVVPLEPENWPQPSPWQPGGGPGDPAPGSGPSSASGSSSSPSDPNAPSQSGPVPGSDAASGSAAPGVVPGPAAAGPYSPWDAGWQRRQERWQRRQARWAARGHDASGPIIFGILLIVVGGLFAWHEVDPAFDLGAAWPLAIIALGVLLVATSMGWRRGE